MWTKNKIDLVKLIIKNHNLTVEEIATIFKLKERQIYTYIQEINYFLKQNKKPLIESTKQKGLTFSLTFEELKKIINKDEYYFSQDERISFICFDILLSNQEKQIDNYIDLFSLSRNTILLDIKKINDFLKKFNLKFSVKNTYFSISGNEISKRYFFINYISSYLLKYEDFIIKKLFSLFVIKNKQIQDILDDYNKEINIKGNENYYSFILMYLSILKTYYEKKSFIEISQNDKEVIGKSKYFKNVLKLTKYLLEENCKGINSKEFENEKYYLTIILASGNLENNTSSTFKHKFLYSNLMDAIKEMLLNIEKTTFMFFYDKDELAKGICNHLILSYYRIKYLPVNFEYVEVIKQKYLIIFDVALKNIGYIEDVLKIKFPDDEIALVALYLANNLFTNIQDRNKVKAVILSDGTINILKNEVENNFLNVSVIKECTIDEFEKFDEPFDLLLTSINFNFKNELNVLKINKILTDEDKKRIEKAVNEIIEDKATINNHLLDILEDKFINIFTQKVDDWKEAIKLSAQPLLDNGYITLEYVNAMIDNISKYNTVITLSNHVVMPHASFRDGVKKLGFSLNIFKNKINFPGEPNKISIVLILAPIDKDSHVKPMFQFLDFLEKKHNVKELLGSKDSKQIYELISKQFQVIK